MDLASSCRDKLAYFRIKELKDVLSKLGLVKQGKKQELVDRIVTLLSDEQVSKLNGKKNSVGKEELAKIIDDIYRKLQAPGATDLASKSHSSSDINYVKPKEEVNDSSLLSMKIRCPCGSSLSTESMIQCEDQRCLVWQHIGCVIIPEKPVEGVQPEIPAQFYCELCRMNRADPFWITKAHPLPSVKLTSPNPAADGTNKVQINRTFQLTRADRDMLQKTEYDLQVWCILLNDKVPFRMQWPQHSDLQVNLQVNGIPVRTTNRPGAQLLGINGRDDGPVITTCSREGLNTISFSTCDARTFCFGIRIARRRTVQQVLSIVPKEMVGEPFEEALARVRRCIGGGTAAENADSDSDLEVVADSVTVNLCCPMSGSRMKTAGRFKPCVHMGCFDLETFVELNQRSRKWQCPVCLKNYSLENIIVDPYFNRITALLQNRNEDVKEIDVRPDGSWRLKNGGDNSRDLGQWHLPDGSPYPVEAAELKPNKDILKEVKLEGVSEGHTGIKLGIKRNHDGTWRVSQPLDMRTPSSGNHAPGKLENYGQKSMPMSSSATGSYRDGEDASVNQEGGGHFDFSINNGHELDSVSFEMYDGNDQMLPVPSKDADIIVLSDSEEDNVAFISPETGYGSGPASGPEISFTATHPGVSESFPVVDPALGASGTSCVGLFGNGEDFEIPLWPLPTGSQTVPGYQFFNTDALVTDDLVDLQHNSLACPPVNGYGLATGGDTGDVSLVQGLSTCHPNGEVNDSLLDNPLAFSGDDPSLQIFLPPQPAGMLAETDLNHHAVISNCSQTDDWISLRLGGDGGNSGESATSNGLNSRHQFGAKDGRMDSLANTASLLLSMNDDRSNKGASNNPRTDSPSSHHARQPRSPFCLSIDSDSD